MNAYHVIGFGGLEKLQGTKVDIPKPGQDEVLIKIYATALNNSDIMMREGGYGTDTSAEEAAGWNRKKVHFPRIPGSDIAGEIVELGENVSKDYLHKKVVLFPFQSSGKIGYEHRSDDLAYIGSDLDGGYAQYVVWKADLAFDMPLPNYDESATFPVSGFTAWQMIKRSQMKEGEKVLVTGATGGVGSLAIQIASKVFGAEVIAVVRDESLKDKMIELGAKNTVSYQEESLEDQIVDVAGGNIDIVLDVVGDAMLSTSLAVLGVGGRMVLSGSSGGAISEVDIRTIYLKHLTIYGSSLGTRQDFSELMEAVSNGKVTPIIDQTFPLNQAKEAQEYFMKSRQLGKVVLIPNESFI